MTIDDCIFKPKQSGEPIKRDGCYACIWIDYGCNLHNPYKMPKQLELFEVYHAKEKEK